ncbi:MAG TPA: hypothetical protein VJB89_03820, partial [Candidatus Nanoarchaeia archaeon]|nr:hypothetical protein [Candidatus Nanoarchaeia archaeon]
MQDAWEVPFQLLTYRVKPKLRFFSSVVEFLIFGYNKYRFNRPISALTSETTGLFKKCLDIYNFNYRKNSKVLAGQSSKDYIDNVAKEDYYEEMVIEINKAENRDGLIKAIEYIRQKRKEML